VVFCRYVGEGDFDPCPFAYTLPHQLYHSLVGFQPPSGCPQRHDHTFFHANDWLYLQERPYQVLGFPDPSAQVEVAQCVVGLKHHA